MLRIARRSPLSRAAAPFRPAAVRREHRSFRSRLAIPPLPHSPASWGRGDAWVMESDLQAHKPDRKPDPEETRRRLAAEMHEVRGALALVASGGASRGTLTGLLRPR